MPGSTKVPAKVVREVNGKGDGQVFGEGDGEISGESPGERPGIRETPSDRNGEAGEEVKIHFDQRAPRLRAPSGTAGQITR